MRLCYENGACRGMIGVIVQSFKDLYGKLFFRYDVLSFQGVIFKNVESVVSLLRLLPTHQNYI
jgi:hypothetical protein